VENKIEIDDWKTPCSNAKGLVWRRTFEEGNTVQVEFETDDDVYKFIFRDLLAYQCYDETFLSYNIPFGGCWTYKLGGATWINQFNSMVNVNFPSGIFHLLITSSDNCFEALSPTYPTIETVRKKDVTEKN
jgi:hypothetical protein